VLLPALHEDMNAIHSIQSSGTYRDSIGSATARTIDLLLEKVHREADRGETLVAVVGGSEDNGAAERCGEGEGLHYIALR
jgi:hypothetical protein